MPRSIHTDEYKKLTAILWSARRRSGMTQQQVADRLGKPQSYVAKVERAERRIDVVEFIALSQAIGVDPVVMFKSLLDELGAPKNNLHRSQKPG